MNKFMQSKDVFQPVRRLTHNVLKDSLGYESLALLRYKTRPPRPVTKKKCGVDSKFNFIPSSLRNSRMDADDISFPVSSARRYTTEYT